VEVGALHASSLLNEEARSKLNKMSSTMISNGEIPDPSKINLWEVNNVCEGGLDLLTTLRNIKPKQLGSIYGQEGAAMFPTPI